MPNEVQVHPVYRAINKPLTVWGAERRLFFLALRSEASECLWPLPSELRGTGQRTSRFRSPGCRRS
jgi:hypothetical protein